MNFRSKIFKLFVWANKVLVRSQVRDKVLYCRTTAGIVSTASVSQISLTHFRQCKEIRASMQTASVAAVISTHKWVRKIVVILVELCVITHLLAKWNQKKSTISGSSHTSVATLLNPPPASLTRPIVASRSLKSLIMISISIPWRSMMQTFTARLLCNIRMCTVHTVIILAVCVPHRNISTCS